MSTTRIRTSHPGDILKLTELTIQLGYTTTAKEIESRINRILHEEDHRVWVALLEEQVVGWIHAFISHRIESDSFVEIGGLVVDLNQRGLGIGQQLTEAVHHWAEQTNFKKVRVRYNVVRERAHSFYEKLGYQLNKEQKVYDFLID